MISVIVYTHWLCIQRCQASAETSWCLISLRTLADFAGSRLKMTADPESPTTSSSGKK